MIKTRNVQRKIQSLHQLFTRLEKRNEKLQKQKEQQQQQLQKEQLNEFSDLENTENKGEDIDIIFRWVPAAVPLLLRTYQNIEDKFSSGKISYKKCWELVSSALKAKGHNISAQQCSSKMRSLKKQYKSIKDYNNKSGNGRKTWQYFEIMEEIFSNKTWCKPKAMASSSGLSLKNVDSESDSASSEINCSNNRSTNLKKSVPELLKRRIEQREQHETIKQARHNERMEIDRKLVEALTKFLEK